MTLKKKNYLHLPESGLNKQRILFLFSTALAISYPTPKEGCVTSATKASNTGKNNKLKNQLRMTASC